MPSALHQTLVRLFEEQPGLLRELLGASLGLPEGPLALLPTDVTDHKPTQLLADVVACVAGADGPRAVVLVEIQLSKSGKKRRVWPHYVTSQWRRFGCRVALVVVALSEEVAAWARQPIEIGPGVVFTPLVIGPAAMPGTAADARRAPELAVLAALANRETERAVELTALALDALRGVPADAATIYGDTLLASLPEAARRALEELMAQGHYEYQSDFAKKYFKQGREQGARDARRSTLRAILEARGIALDEATRDRIERTEDVERLDAWIGAAAVATTAAAVFGE